MADQGGPAAEREKKWTLFPADAAKTVKLSLYNKEQGKFETMTLEEVTNKKIDMKEEAKHSEHSMNDTSGLSDIGDVTRQSEHSRIETAVNQVIDNMNRLGVRNRDVNIVPADCVGEIRNNERIRKEQFDHSDNNRNSQQGGRNKDERVVPPLINKGNQPSG